MPFGHHSPGSRGLVVVVVLKALNPENIALASLRNYSGSQRIGDRLPFGTWSPVSRSGRRRGVTSGCSKLQTLLSTVIWLELPESIYLNDVESYRQGWESLFKKFPPESTTVSMVGDTICVLRQLQSKRNFNWKHHSEA